MIHCVNFGFELNAGDDEFFGHLYMHHHLILFIKSLLGMVDDFKVLGFEGLDVSDE